MCVARSTDPGSVEYTPCLDLLRNLDGGLYASDAEFTTHGGEFGCSISTTGEAGIDQVEACQDETSQTQLNRQMSDICSAGPDCLIGVCMKFPSL